MARVSMTVNGVQYDQDVEPRLLLVHFLRDTLGLTGTHVGCDTSNCGACTVHLDGDAVKSCTVLAVQADGSARCTTPRNAGSYLYRVLFNIHSAPAAVADLSARQIEVNCFDSQWHARGHSVHNGG